NQHRARNVRGVFRRARKGSVLAANGKDSLLDDSSQAWMPADARPSFSFHRYALPFQLSCPGATETGHSSASSPAAADATAEASESVRKRARSAAEADPPGSQRRSGSETGGGGRKHY